MMKKRWRPKRHGLYFGLGPVSRQLAFEVAWLDTPFPELTTDLNDPVVTAEDLDGVEAAVIEAHPYDALPPPVSRVEGLIRYASFSETMFLVDLRGSFEHYLGKFKAKSRHNILRERRLFCEASNGVLECRAYSSPDEITEFRRIASAISAKTYQTRIGLGFHDGSGSAETLAALAAQGTVRGYILYSGETPAAFAFCRINGSTIRYTNVGYDPEFRKWSPGSVLLVCLIERLFEESRFDWLDLEFGSWYGYKHHHSTHRVPFVQLWFLRPSLRNLCIVHAHRLNRKLERWAVGLKRRLKGQGRA